MKSQKTKNMPHSKAKKVIRADGMSSTTPCGRVFAFKDPKLTQKMTEVHRRQCDICPKETRIQSITETLVQVNGAKVQLNRRFERERQHSTNEHPLYAQHMANCIGLEQ